MALRKIKLYGRLAEQYTPEIELDCDDLRSAIAGIESNFPGFRQDFIDNEWHILRGDLTKEDCMTNEEALMCFGDKLCEIHIYPKIEGEGGNRNVWTIVIGIIIIAVAWYAAPALVGGGAGVAGGSGGMAAGVGAGGAVGLVSYGAIASVGVSLVLSGVAGMMAATPGIGDPMAAERAQDKPSFLFNGAVNVMVAGGPVPLLYGEMEVGSTVVSAGLVTEKIYIPPPPPPPEPPPPPPPEEVPATDPAYGEFGIPDYGYVRNQLRT